MKKRPFSSLPGVLVLVFLVGLPGCSDSRSLQSVTISPAVANSSAQFSAMGSFNKSPTSADITATTTWCIGSSDGVCAGNINTGATVNSGTAQCGIGFTGSVTVLAGQSGSMANPDSGVQLKPFGAAQLNCP
jgi:hypothetical protein